MTDIIWPAALPACPLRPGYGETPRPNAIVFSPEVGDDIVRRRSTVRVSDIQMSFEVTRGQYQVFLNFFRDELMDGVRPFRMPNKITFDDMVVRFNLSEAPYSIAPAPGLMLLLRLSLRRVER